MAPTPTQFLLSMATVIPWVQRYVWVRGDRLSSPMVGLMLLLLSPVVSAATVFTVVQGSYSWRVYVLADDSCMQPCLDFLFVDFLFFSSSFSTELAPRVEQQGCFHGNTEASDWQSVVSVVLLPNPQHQLPLHCFKYWTFSEPSGGESAGPLELTRLYWYVDMAFLILNQEDSRAFSTNTEKIL